MTKILSPLFLIFFLHTAFAQEMKTGVYANGSMGKLTQTALSWPLEATCTPRWAPGGEIGVFGILPLEKKKSFFKASLSYCVIAGNNMEEKKPFLDWISGGYYSMKERDRIAINCVNAGVSFGWLFNKLSFCVAFELPFVLNTTINYKGWHKVEYESTGDVYYEEYDYSYEFNPGQFNMKTYFLLNGINFEYNFTPRICAVSGFRFSPNLIRRKSGTFCNISYARQFTLGLRYAVFKKGLSKKN